MPDQYKCQNCGEPLTAEIGVRASFEVSDKGELDEVANGGYFQVICKASCNDEFNNEEELREEPLALYTQATYNALERKAQAHISGLHLTKEETATALAALRFYQKHCASAEEGIRLSCEPLEEVADIASGGGAFAPMRSWDMDPLCEKINS